MTYMNEGPNVNESIKTLSDFINIASINPPGVEELIAKYIEDYLNNFGLNTEKIYIDEKRYNVLSRIKGKNPKAKKIIFNGHMDVVPVSESEQKLWKTDPFHAQIIGGKLYGRGSSDMKSGLAAAMIAMCFLKRNHLIPEGDVLFLATVDEEDTMKGIKAVVDTDLLNDVDYAVVCEPTHLKLANQCKGRTWSEVSVLGESAHASIRDGGHNAISDAIDIIQAIRKHRLPNVPDTILEQSFWQVNLINGGIEPAIVPDLCNFTVDARVSPGHSCDFIWSQLELLIDSLPKKYKWNYKILEKREPWQISPSEPLPRECCKYMTDLGMSTELSAFHGTTDGTVLFKHGITPVIIGPGGMELAHRENEYVTISEFEQAIYLYLNIMMNGIKA